MLNRRLAAIVSVAIACAGAAPQVAAQSSTGDVRSGLPTAQPDTAPLRAGDVVRMRIWREPEFTGDFPVDELGMVTFPRVGVWHVTSMTPRKLKDSLQVRFSAFLLDPAIEMTLLRRVKILGAVGRPGIYPVDRTMTIADALALAGGITGAAKRDEVQLIRGSRSEPLVLRRGMPMMETPLESGDQLFVPERNWIVQNAPLISIGFSTLLTIVTIFRR